MRGYVPTCSPRPFPCPIPLGHTHSSMSHGSMVLFMLMFMFMEQCSSLHHWTHGLSPALGAPPRCAVSRRRVRRMRVVVPMLTVTSRQLS